MRSFAAQVLFPGSFRFAGFSSKIDVERLLLAVIQVSNGRDQVGDLLGGRRAGNLELRIVKSSLAVTMQ